MNDELTVEEFVRCLSKLSILMLNLAREQFDVWYRSIICSTNPIIRFMKNMETIWEDEVVQQFIEIKVSL